ncbi:4Fe-4S dicluster domain-containing protein [Deltaproteobacteria bacterium TL4]
MRRRNFLKILGATGGALLGNSAQAKAAPKQEFVGVLTDTTRCVGCRSCEQACAQVHDLPVPDVETDSALEKERKTSATQWTVVNRYKTDKGEVFVKRQCMHCWQPACTAACLTNAMYKTQAGPIIWRKSMCMGCRYCMVSCPFEIPKAEYNTWNPKIQKCNMCWERLEEGKKPACVQVCPTGALTFGMKKDLLETARTQIYRHPSKYVRHIYGEYEVGGTGWLYLAAVPFDQLGFRTDLGTLPYPEFTKEFLYAVPSVILMVPPLLYGLQRLTDGQKKKHEEEGDKL